MLPHNTDRKPRIMAKKKPATGPKRINVSDADFITAVYKGNSVAEVAKALGLKESSVTQRIYTMRNAGVALKTFSNGSGGKRDADTLNELIAKLSGKDVDEVKAEGKKLAKPKKKGS